MKILIVGLGLIGASLAKALKPHYFVDGYDIDESVVKFALKNNIINAHSQAFSSYDFVIVALPPQAAIDFINATNFKDGAVVSDICGVKEHIQKSVISRNFYYIGTHPMAGKEVGGIKNSSERLFCGASLIITVNEKTNLNSLICAENVYNKAGFARVIKCDEIEHDKIIAYTSQLAHIVSSAYVKSPTYDYFDGFTGGSFQDMTRIAAMDEKIWSQLFLMNSTHLKKELKILIDSLKKYYDALDKKDELELINLIKEGREIKQTQL